MPGNGRRDLKRRSSVVSTPPTTTLKKPRTTVSSAHILGMLNGATPLIQDVMEETRQGLRGKPLQTRVPSLSATSSESPSSSVCYYFFS